MGGLCKHGIPEGVESVPLRHQTSIQKVSDACGFGNLKSRTWNAPVYGITPEASMPEPCVMSTSIHSSQRHMHLPSIRLHLSDVLFKHDHHSQQ